MGGQRQRRGNRGSSGGSNNRSGGSGGGKSTEAATTPQKTKRDSDEANKSGSSRGGRDDADNGFAQWGGYMAAKKMKLDEQFNNSMGTRRSGGFVSTIFSGVSVYINGYTNPPEPELKEMFTKHGGEYNQYVSSSTTFVIATNLAAAKKRLYAAKSVKPEWIVDSIKEGKKLDHRNYLLFDLNKENKQQTLPAAFMPGKKPAAAAAAEAEAASPPPVVQMMQVSIRIRRCDDPPLKVEATSTAVAEPDKPTTAPPPPQPLPGQENEFESPLVSALSRSSSSKKAKPLPPEDSDSDSDVEIIDVIPATPPKSCPKVAIRIQGPTPPKASTADLEGQKKQPTSKADEHESPLSVSADSDIKSSATEDSGTGSSLQSETSTIPPPPLPLVTDQSDSDPATTITESPPRADTSTATATATKLQPKMKTAAEEGFLQEFYQNSRLHLISTLKKERQQNVSEWRKKKESHKLPLLSKFMGGLNCENLPEEIQKSKSAEDAAAATATATVLFHIDLDCFFVSVARLSRPHLLHSPLVITHSKGTDSRSDIACASYEARAKGISAGMWLHQAKELCPEVVVVPYEFEEYSRVSKLFYETVASLTLEMEAISCDEMLINVSNILNSAFETKPGVQALDIKSHAIQLANFLVQEIRISTGGVGASIGIGANRLLTKLATRVAKDEKAGCHFMELAAGRAHIRKEPVSKLPGVGWATVEKLETLGVKLGSELEKLSLEELKKQFGEKTGQKLYNVCRGVDSDKVKTESAQAKSISAGCSFGVRLSNSVEFDKFLKEVAEEATSRAEVVKCCSNKVVLSLWIVRKGYEGLDTVKPGGHGMADVHTKGVQLKQRTRSGQVISSTVKELARGIMKDTVLPQHIRGVSISLDALTYDDDLSEKERKSVQPTLFAQFQKQHHANVAAAKSSRTRSSTSTSPPTKRDKSPSPATALPSKRVSSGPKSPSPDLFPDTETEFSESRSTTSTTTTTTTSAARSSTTTTMPINPYADVNELDPEYLAALPQSVRAEVELEFQKAKQQQQQNGSTTSASGGASSSSSRSKLRVPSPKKTKFGKNSKSSPLKKKKGGAAAIKSPPQKPGSSSVSPTKVNNNLSRNGLYRYYTAISNAKKNPPPPAVISPLSKSVRQPPRRKEERSNSQQSSPTNSQSSHNNNNNNTTTNTNSVITEQNRLTPSSDDVATPPPDDTEMDEELKTLLKTPTKKSDFELEQMVRSFNTDADENENEKLVAGNSENSNSRSSMSASRKTSTDSAECAQRLISRSSSTKKSRKKLVMVDDEAIPCSSSSLVANGGGGGGGGECSKNLTTTTAGEAAAGTSTEAEEIEMQEALLKYYARQNGNRNGGGAEEDETDGLYEDSDRLSVANNVDSDKDDLDDDLAELEETESCPTTTNDGGPEMELPPLNGVTDIDKVHELIRSGITDRLPTEDDVECLTTYFHELAATFLTQACNSLRFLQALRVELSTKGGGGSKEWYDVFGTIINDTQQIIQDDFGGLFRV